MNYDQTIRSLVRDQGEPAHFEPLRLKLTNVDLAAAVREYTDALPEVAAEVLESVAACLDGNSSFVGHFRSKEEAIGTVLVAALRARLLPRVRLDAKCKANDMEREDKTDDEYEHGGVHA